MTVELVSALISGLVAIVSVTVSAIATARTIRIQHDLELRRHHLMKIASVEDVMSRYKDPLIQAASELEGRVHNILHLDFARRHLASTDPEERRYAKLSTLFRLAEYFAWVEILRQGIQFLDFGSEQRSRELTQILYRVSITFADTHKFGSAAFRLFRDEQRAYGELAMEPVADGSGYRCMAYVRFVASLEADEAFARWFARLSGEIDQLTNPPGGYLDRLTQLKRVLTDLLIFLDPKGVHDPIGRQRSAVIAVPQTAGLDPGT